MLRNIFAFVFLLISGVMIAAFFVVLNIRLAIFSEDKLLNTFDKSGIYNQVSGALKEQLISDNTGLLNEGSFFEELNESAGPKSVNLSVSNIASQFFDLDGRTSNEIRVVFPEEEFRNKSISEPIFDQQFRIPQQVVILKNKIDIVLIATGVIVLIFLAVFIVTCSKTAAAKSVWLGLLLVFTATLFGTIYYLQSFTLGPLVEAKLASLNLSKQLIIGAQNLLKAIVAKNNSFILIELIASFVIGVSLISLGNSRKQKTLDFGDQI